MATFDPDHGKRPQRMPTFAPSANQRSEDEQPGEGEHEYHHGSAVHPVLGLFLGIGIFLGAWALISNEFDDPAREDKLRFQKDMQEVLDKICTFVGDLGRFRMVHGSGRWMTNRDDWDELLKSGDSMRRELYVPQQDKPVERISFNAKKRTYVNESLSIAIDLSISVLKNIKSPQDVSPEKLHASSLAAVAALRRTAKLAGRDERNPCTHGKHYFEIDSALHEYDRYLAKQFPKD